MAEQDDQAFKAHIDAFIDAELSFEDPVEGRPLPQGTLLAVAGLSGSGKSTLARRLIEEFNTGARPVDWIRTDEVRKELAGVPVEQKLPAEFYSRDFSAKTYAEFDRRVAEGLKQGHLVIGDGTFMKESQRDGLKNLAETCNAAFNGLWLDTPPEIMKARADARKGDASDADSAVIDMQLKADLGRIDWVRLDAGGTADSTYAQAMTYLKGRGVVPGPK